MTAADRLNEIEARANAATEGPWTPDEYTEVDPDGFYELARVIAPDPDGDDWCAIGVVHTGILRPDAEFIAHARTDVPALVAALRAVLDLHRESRNDADHTPPCEHCHGEPGVHECGCWADEKWPTVCAVCMEGTKGASVAWPCPTVRAIEEALNA